MRRLSRLHQCLPHSQDEAHVHQSRRFPRQLCQPPHYASPKKPAKQTHARRHQLPIYPLLLHRRPELRHARCSSEVSSDLLHTSRAHQCRCPCACRRPSYNRAGSRLPRQGLRWCQGESAPAQVHVPLVCVHRHRASVVSSRHARLFLLPLAAQRACRWPLVVLLVTVWDRRLAR